MKKATYDFVLAVLLLSTLCLFPPHSDGQNMSALAAPMPTQLQAAKKIFISNEGVDAIASLLVDGDDGRIYRLVFNRAKSSGRYELVLNPAEADLVWTLQFIVVTTANGLTGTSPDYYPQLRLAIVDPKTHIVLWTMTTKVEKAFREKTFGKNIEVAVDTLITKMTTLTSPPSGTQ